VRACQARAKLKLPANSERKWPLLASGARAGASHGRSPPRASVRIFAADAVTNVQNSMLLLAAFVQGRRIRSLPRWKIACTSLTGPSCPLLPALQKISTAGPAPL